MTTTLDTSNKLFTLASNLVNYTSENIFLTGKAGTGKTTFLRHIRNNCQKQMAVVAPTGVAAINAGGVTIHSFFQLPFTPYVPDTTVITDGDGLINKHQLLGRLRYTKERIKIVRELELLIIDEISMVRCDLLDTIDVVLRHFRNSSGRFGGVQVLFIGDMYQLPPVAKQEEWRILSQFYSSPFFFDSDVLKNAPPVYIEFEKIYRQTDQEFIDLLNQVRNNALTPEGKKLLDSRFVDSQHTSREEGRIVLTTHNETARQINTRELETLAGKTSEYTAETDGEFPDTAAPADKLLQLKVGAQVMFLKNDAESRRYYNGRIGVVKALHNDLIVVACPAYTRGEDDDIIEVSRETWENIRYTVDQNTRKIDEQVLGSFKQFPLRLAWAITIHKSQGLTFEKADIDAGAAFAPGQVYVALSRCTTLDGVRLHSTIRANSFLSDPRIAKFTAYRTSDGQLQQLYALAKSNYQLSVISSLFDFAAQSKDAESLQEYMLKNRGSFNDEAHSWSADLADQLRQLQLTAGKFQRQLQSLFHQDIVPAENDLLVQRIDTAKQWFLPRVESLVRSFSSPPVVTDSRQHATEVNDLCKEIFTLLSRQKYLLDGCSGKFNMDKYHSRKNQFKAPPLPFNSYTANASNLKELPHEVLFKQLKSLRDDICRKKDLPVYMVLSTKALEEMCTYLPQTINELSKISGFGNVKLQQYGELFLRPVIQYAEEHGLQSTIAEKQQGRTKKDKKSPSNKPTTKEESFRLFKEGRSIAEIAAERRLAISTVEGHLAYFVENGSIDVRSLVKEEKIKRITALLESATTVSFTAIKEQAGTDISFGEIRLISAAFNRKTGDQPAD